MKYKIESGIFFSIFFLIIIFVPIYWLINLSSTNQNSLIEGRVLHSFPTLSYREFKTAVKRIVQMHPEQANELFFNQFFDRSYQLEYENAVKDEFPARMTFIQIDKALDRKIIEMSYMFLPDPAIPTDMDSRYYISRDHSVIISRPEPYNEDTVKIISNRILNYNQLIDENPQIHFNVFYLERLSVSSFSPLNQYFPESDKGRGYEYFIENKPKGLNIGTMRLTGFNDHLLNFFRTDHHWNATGTIKAYYIIYDLLKQNYPDISPALSLESSDIFPKINFYGSMARKTMYPIASDKFEVVTSNLPPFTALENGVNEIVFGKRLDYLAGNYDSTKYVNHYMEYYGGDIGFVEYIFNNNSDRNLLLIGSSFANPLEPLIASHYNHTYSIDFRYFKDFSFSQFVSNHPIDDVLIIGDNTVDFNDDKEWLIHP